ncbi:hypothetical protein ILYODFUR_015033 [Ilyodon furcidens]|uniref:Uncharacterized protein n=1 Tax=Ilyodon furcidens TaxID=33524 RepID=A0ABV0TAF9_9TELE
MELTDVWWRRVKVKQMRDLWTPPAAIHRPTVGSSLSAHRHTQAGVKGHVAQELLAVSTHGQRILGGSSAHAQFRSCSQRTDFRLSSDPLLMSLCRFADHFHSLLIHL